MGVTRTALPPAGPGGNEKDGKYIIAVAAFPGDPQTNTANTFPYQPAAPGKPAKATTPVAVMEADAKAIMLDVGVLPAGRKIMITGPKKSLTDVNPDGKTVNIEEVQGISIVNAVNAKDEKKPVTVKLGALDVPDILPGSALMRIRLKKGQTLNSNNVKGARLVANGNILSGKSFNAVKDGDEVIIVIPPDQYDPRISTAAAQALGMKPANQASDIVELTGAAAILQKIDAKNFDGAAKALEPVIARMNAVVHDITKREEYSEVELQRIKATLEGLRSSPKTEGLMKKIDAAQKKAEPHTLELLQKDIEAAVKAGTPEKWKAIKETADAIQKVMDDDAEKKPEEHKVSVGERKVANRLIKKAEMEAYKFEVEAAVKEGTAEKWAAIKEKTDAFRKLLTDDAKKKPDDQKYTEAQRTALWSVVRKADDEKKKFDAKKAPDKKKADAGKPAGMDTLDLTGVNTSWAADAAATPSTMLASFERGKGGLPDKLAGAVKKDDPGFDRGNEA